VQKINHITTEDQKKTGCGNSPFLDTLAQPGTRTTKTPFQNSVKSLKRRASAKFLTNLIILPLIDLESPLQKAYWRSYHCTELLLQNDNKITSQYCKNRWCVVCNRIRTAQMIINYLPVIKKEITEPYFVTLTIPNCEGRELSDTINKMIKTFIKINHTFRYRKSYRVKGIRKLECTYNAERGTFHPHFHFILDTREAAERLVEAWLSHYPEAKSVGQNIKKADENSLIELFKYTTKLLVGKPSRSGNNGVVFNIIPEALDVIFTAMYKKRVYQPISIKKVPYNEDMEDIEGIQSQEINDIVKRIEVWEWEQGVSDWVSPNGELLTGCNAHESYKVVKS